MFFVDNPNVTRNAVIAIFKQSTVDATLYDQFGTNLSDNINRMITITGYFYLVIFSKQDLEM